LEYWFLLREPQEGLLRAPRDRQLVELLREGPQPVPEILRDLGVLHVGQLSVQELRRQEVIGRAGLTFTDLMHLEGRYAVWDASASEHAWQVFCQFQFKDPDQVRDQVWSHSSEIIIHAIITFLSRRRLQLTDRQHALEDTDDDMGRWFFYNSLYGGHPHLGTLFRLHQPIIGIGAPASIFLPDVARLLNTELILPEHHQVANAVGAIAGSVMVEEELLVYPQLSRSGLEVMGYYVQASDDRAEFEELCDALAYARALSQERALGGALRSGADNPQVTVEEMTDGLDAYRIRAKAIGNPRLAR
jgi:hypothetical protein